MQPRRCCWRCGRLFLLLLLPMLLLMLPTLPKLLLLGLVLQQQLCCQAAAAACGAAPRRAASCGSGIEALEDKVHAMVRTPHSGGAPRVLQQLWAARSSSTEQAPMCV